MIILVSSVNCAAKLLTNVIAITAVGPCKAEETNKSKNSAVISEKPLLDLIFIAILRVIHRSKI